MQHAGFITRSDVIKTKFIILDLRFQRLGELLEFS